MTLRNVSGGPRKDYILEAAGNGAAFFDYDDDGDMDLLLVNGSTFEKFKQGGGPMVALYSNDGKGKFSDVTGQSGLTKKGWGMGVCVADYDNSGSRTSTLLPTGRTYYFEIRATAPSPT